MIIRVYGENHYERANASENLASVLIQMNEIPEAIRLLTLSYNIRREVFGDNHADVAKTLLKLGQAYSLSDNPEHSNEGMHNFRKAYEIFKSIYGVQN